MASTAAAVRRLDALFRDASSPPHDVITTVEVTQDRNCDIHGTPRRGSLGNILRTTRKDSLLGGSGGVSGAVPIVRRRDSSGGIASLSPLPKEQLDHPERFPGTLRKDSADKLVTRPRRFSTDSLDGRRSSWDPGRRGSSSSSGGFDEPLWEEKHSKVR